MKKPGRDDHEQSGQDTWSSDRHDRGPDRDDLPPHDGFGTRVRAAICAAIAALPAALRRHHAAQPDATSLERLVGLMRQWVRGGQLHQASFAEHFFGRDADDPIVTHLRDAVRMSVGAKSHEDLREASTAIAEAQQIVGLDRWSRFLTDAESRAGDLETKAAVENSRPPPEPAEDAVSPEWPMEVPDVGAEDAAAPDWPLEEPATVAAEPVGGADNDAVSGELAAGAAGAGSTRQFSRTRPVGETPQAILLPGGKPIGGSAGRETYRAVSGSKSSADDMFRRLTDGGTGGTPPISPGTHIQMPNGNSFGYRGHTGNGSVSIDVRVPGVNITKLKFPGTDS